MSVRIQAGFFIVKPDTPTSDIDALCKKHAARKKVANVEIDFKSFRVTDLVWHKTHKALTATMWRVRDSQLPSKLKADRASALGIANDESVGEASSFAYSPGRQIAIVEYNHTGPRHPILRELLYEMGVSTPIEVSPILETGAFERAQEAELIRRIEFSLASSEKDKIDRLRNAGGAVKDALDAMADVGGMTVHVTISMGHHREGLSSKAMGIIETLCNGGSRVQTLKATIKEKDETTTQLVDLLGGRQTTDLEVPEKDRELDHAACRRQLLTVLSSFGK